MMRQYLLGAAASVCNIAIHALVMVIVIRVTRIADELATAHQSLRLIAVMIAAIATDSTVRTVNAFITMTVRLPQLELDGDFDDDVDRRTLSRRR